MTRKTFPRLAVRLFLVGGCCAGAWLAPAKTQVLQTRERYALEAGDQLEVKFRLTPEFNQTVTVQPDGFIDLPITGELRVATLTVHKAESAIAAATAARLKDPDVSISLLSFHKPFFVVAGQVTHPGRFEMQEDTTALQAILLAGGPTEDGRVSQVVVFRRVAGNNADVKILDLNHMKKTADLERDMQLQSGDMLYVPQTRISKAKQVVRLATDMGVYVNPLQRIP